MMKKIKFLSLYLLFSIQFKVEAQKLKTFKLNNKYYSNHSLDYIELPFWDDFSSSKIINNHLWSNSKNISVKDFINIGSLSKNVILFDGIDENGDPFNNDNGYGISDVLTSDIINMKNLLLSDSVYFSFFWRFNINGELPDDEDSLYIDFLNNDNNWETVWSENGGIDNFNNQFIFEDILLNEEFLHESFQFKIYNKGNSKGPFDSWLIDYIFLDKKRSRYDSTFLDRTLAHNGYKILKNYISIPLDHFSYSNKLLDSVNIIINNLDKNIHPINYSSVAEITSENRKFIYDNKVPLSPILNGYEKRNVKLSPIYLSDLKSSSDSIVIDFSFYIDSGDSTLLNQNFLLNDSANFSLEFSNYYSYDDGTAEYAAGLNQKNSELVVLHETLTKDTLTHLNLYFPKNIYSNYNNQIEILVYDNIEDDNKLSSQLITPEFSDEFISYKLNKPIIVSDTFYIGFKQLENSFLPVGLDKNNNTSDKIFYKIDNNWNQNDIVKGSIMIRPIFGKSDFIITELNYEKLESFFTNIYPNPSKGTYKFDKIIDEAKIYDRVGRLLQVYKKTDKINITDYENGTYIIMIKNSGKYQVNKLIKSE